MLLPLLALLQAGLAPAPDYLIVDAPGGTNPAGFAAVVAQAMPSARASALPGTLFQACADWNFSDHVNRCVRALLPDGAGPAPSIAFVIHPVARSNVTGSVVHRSHTIYCVAARGTARIELSGLWSRTGAQALAPRLAECAAIATAGGGDWGGGVHRTGSVSWRFPIVENQLAANAPQARGWGAERAIFQIISAETTHRTSGRCGLSGRIVYVEAGRRLRAGDVFTLTAPCHWEGEDRVSPIFTQNFGAGTTARLYLRYEDGALAYVEAL